VNDTDLLAQMDAFEVELTTLLSLLATDDQTDEALASATASLAGFASLMTRLEAGSLPENTEFEAKLKVLRLKHGLLLDGATSRQVEVGKALTKVREVRRKAGFYGSSGSEVGVSCDMSG